MRRWRGLLGLVEDAVEHGSRAIEGIQGQAWRRAFDLLERVPPLARPARLARSIQETILAGTYRTIRLANRAVGVAVGVAIDAAEASRPRPGSVAPPTARAPTKR